jgi:hypothetical protein
MYRFQRSNVIEHALAASPSDVVASVRAALAALRSLPVKAPISCSYTPRVVAVRRPDW